MKLLLLRGGASVSAGAGQRQRQDTADCGITAIGSGGHWVLVNISTAVARQLQAPSPAMRLHGLTPDRLRGLVLTDAQIEHAAGLLAMRNGPTLDLYTTPAVFEELSVQLPVLPALQHYCGVHWRVVPVAGDRRSASFRIDALPTLEFTAFATIAPPWPHLSSQRAVVGDSIALAVRDLVTGMRLYCAPGLPQPGPEELQQMEHSDCLLLDGLNGLQEQAEASSAWLDWLQQLPARHKLLLSDSADPRQLARRGFALAVDGMEIDL